MIDPVPTSQLEHPVLMLLYVIPYNCAKFRIGSSLVGRFDFIDTVQKIFESFCGILNLLHLLKVMLLLRLLLDVLLVEHFI